MSGCGAVGSALALGARGRQFESGHPDHTTFVQRTPCGKPLFLRFFTLALRVSSVKMYYVYLIRSISNPTQIYTGFTGNLTQRLEYHNTGKSLYTKNYMPWKLIAYFAFEAKEKATDFEKYLKTGSGYEFIRRRIL